MVFNKLVRDKIPAMIEEKGERCTVRILADEEYRQCLERKLDEEVGEFHRDQSLEELADILEVVYALTDCLGASREELMKTYTEKHEQRGGFSERIFLISKE